MNTTAAYNELLDMHLFAAANKVYFLSWGVWFWPAIFIVTLLMLYIKTENPGYIVVYSIIGHFMMFGFLPVQTQPIFYGTMVFSLALTLWSFFGSGKVDAN